MNKNYSVFKNSWSFLLLISTFSFGKIKTAKSTLLILVLLLLTTTKGFSQCAYTGTPLTQVGGDYTFCIDNVQTYTTPAVNAGQYVVVNIVKGFNYTFSVGNVFTGDDENLTLFNTTNNSNSGLGATSHVKNGSGGSITWTATFSGKVKVLLSKGSCVNDNSKGGALTLRLNNIGNTQDSQTAFGTDTWVGHVYNLVAGTPIPPGGNSPTNPSATNPFTNAYYVGYYNIATETINEGFGGDQVCFPVTSAATNIYTETFAVRYRMRSTKTGYYLLNVSGDDGIRVYVDNVLVFDAWKEQSITTYCNNLIYLKGNSDIVFDYYENGGQNVVNFSLAPFDTLPNVIAGDAVRNVCSNATQPFLDGSKYESCTASAIANVTFQWQISSDGAIFTDITGTPAQIAAARLEDYTPVNPGANTVRYYRRLIKPGSSNGAGSPSYSNVIRVNTGSTTAPSQPGAISGTANQCISAVEQVYSIANVADAVNYTWTVPTGWNITAGQGTTSITVTPGTAGQNGNISVMAFNGCATSSVKTLPVIVSPASVGGTVASAQTICSGTSPADLKLTGQTGNVVKWQKSPDATFNSGVLDVPGTATTLPSTSIGNLTANTYFRAVVQSGACSVSNSTAVLITVNPNLPASVSVAASATTICSGTNVTFTATPTNGGASPSYQWKVNGTNVGTNSATYSSTTLVNANTVTVVMTSTVSPCSTGSLATSNTVTMTVNPNLPASVSIAASATTICSGTNVTFTATPTNGGTPTYQWKNGATNVGTNSPTFTSNTLNNGDKITVIMTSNSTPCLSGSPATSNVLTMAVNPVTVGGSVSGAKTICSGSNSGVLTLSGHTGTVVRWESAVSPFSSWTSIGNTNTTYTSGALTQTTQFRAVLQSGGCTTATSLPVLITVNPSAVLTLNKVNQSCPASNNGTISPVLSGGLTNIRYIKLTQKYVNGDAWQQVKEIQAFEIFTGTNVALKSNGATAAASSVYVNNAQYSADKAIDGDFSTFWHSNSTNINEYIKIDLQAGKNLDGLRIYNRTDCCSERGQNMLLELFDASDNLLYSKNVDLRGVNGTANFVDVNIMDVSWTDSVNSLNRTGLGAGTYTLNYSDVVGCSTSSTVTIASTNATNTAGAASASPTVCLNSPLPVVTHAITGATGIGTASGLPAGVTAAWDSNNITISGTPTVSGIFNYSIPLTGGCGNIIATGTITVGGVTTYDGTTWVGGNPDIYMTAIFNGDYNTTSGNITACNCQIQSGKTLKIGAGSSATIQNNIINNGNIVVESDGNLVQVNDAGTYSGSAANFVVKRNANLKRLDYNYWASPVKGQQLKAFSPGTLASRFLIYDEKDDFFYPITTTYNFGDDITGSPESEAKGYAIRANNNYPATNAVQIFEGKFTGIPNNGVVTFPLKTVHNGYNLVGNPYSSNLDFELLFNNNSDHINYIAYFWTNTNYNPPMQGSGYPGTGIINNYAILNGTGGVPATEGAAAPGGGLKIPNRYIKVGQGFVVKAKNTADLQFKNNVRSDNSTSVFFNKNGSTPDRYWLQLKTPLEVVTTQLIGYVPQATNDFELDYDAPLMVLGSDAFYSVLNNHKLAIQGKASFVNTDVVSLGSSHYEAGSYTISLSEKEGVFAKDQYIYLKDKQTNTVTNLSAESYTFAANAGLTEGRFEIIYQNDLVLGAVNTNKDQLTVYKDGSDFVVKSLVATISDLELYDASGRLINKMTPNKREIRIDSNTLANGVYVIKINRNGEVNTKKITK